MTQELAAVSVLLFALGIGVVRAETLGPETGLPVPRFVSMKANEANIRRGPSLTHRVDWVFRHQGLPLIVTGEYGHWRRVVDRDGMGGWVHYALLSGARTVIVDEDLADMHSSPDAASAVRARAERGVIARLGDCDGAWCEIRADGERGWVEKAGLWGVDLRQPDQSSTVSNAPDTDPPGARRPRPDAAPDGAAIPSPKD